MGDNEGRTTVHLAARKEELGVIISNVIIHMIYDIRLR